MTNTVMLIHGAWLSPTSWEPFQRRYEARGYACVAPAWPYDDRPVAELRRAPHPELATLTIGRIVAHYEQLIRQLAEPPILIGHSFGGLIVQLLLDRGLGAAGIAIDPAPPRGVIARPRAVWTSRAVFLTWNGWNRTLMISPEHFTEGFVHQLPPAEQRAAYERHAIPTPGRIFYQAAIGLETRVHYANPDRAPLLLIAGGNDRTVTASMVRATYRRQRRSSSVTELLPFPGRSHWLIAEPGWEEVADAAIEWAADRADARPQRA